MGHDDGRIRAEERVHARKATPAPRWDDRFMALRRKGNADPGLDVPAPRRLRGRPRQRRPAAVGAPPPPPVWWVMAGGEHTAQSSWEPAGRRRDRPAGRDGAGDERGALTGAVVAEDPVAAVNRLTYLWSDLELSDIIGADWASVMSPTNLAKASLADGAGSGHRWRRLLRAALRRTRAAVRGRRHRPRQRSADAARRGELIPALLASSAIPGVLPRCRSADGGSSTAWRAPTCRQHRRPARRRQPGRVRHRHLSVRPTGTSLQQIVPALNSLLAAQQRVSSLTHAAGRIPVVYLPTPAGWAAR